jgi:hypothetical protein
MSAATSALRTGPARRAVGTRRLAGGRAGSEDWFRFMEAPDPDVGKICRLHG